MQYSLVHIQSTEQVEFYSVKCDADNISLFQQFLNEHTRHHVKKTTHILQCITEIGMRGARQEFFRHEAKNGELVAIPKKQFSSPPSFMENGELRPNNLRLYCHKLNEHVVILFGGGLKTENDPLQCSNVRAHFINGNEFCNCIDKALIEKDIFWTSDFRDIITDDFYFEL